MKIKYPSFLLFAINLLLIVFTNSIDCFGQTKYVIDEANLLNDVEKTELNNLASQYDINKKVQIVIVTTKGLEGETIGDFSLKTANDLGIGYKGINSGVLIAVASNERELRIEVGYGIEWQIPDSVAKKIIDIIVPSFKTQEYYKGLKQGVEKIIELTQNLDWTIAYKNDKELFDNQGNSENKIASLKIKKIKKIHQNIAYCILFNKQKIQIKFSSYQKKLIVIWKDGNWFVRIIKNKPFIAEFLGETH